MPKATNPNTEDEDASDDEFFKWALEKGNDEHLEDEDDGDGDGDVLGDEEEGEEMDIQDRKAIRNELSGKNSLESRLDALERLEEEAEEKSSREGKRRRATRFDNPEADDQGDVDEYFDLVSASIVIFDQKLIHRSFICGQNRSTKSRANLT